MVDTPDFIWDGDGTPEPESTSLGQIAPPDPSVIGARNDPAYIEYLERRISAVESALGVGESGQLGDSQLQRIDEIERLLNSSNVYHYQFWPRALAIYGHVIALALLINGVILFLAFAVPAFFGGR